MDDRLLKDEPMDGGAEVERGDDELADGTGDERAEDEPIGSAEVEHGEPAGSARRSSTASPLVARRSSTGRTRAPFASLKK